MERDKTRAQRLQLVKHPHEINQGPVPAIEPPDHNGIDVSTSCGPQECLPLPTLAGP
jgi:hypothetical protein